MVVAVICITTLVWLQSKPQQQKQEKQQQQKPELEPFRDDNEDILFHENKVRDCDTCTDFSNTNVVVGKSKYKGRGVFANKDMRTGDVIEVCPVLLELKENIPGNNVMTDYVFSTTVPGEVAFSMGYCGIFNHDDRPNAAWAVDRIKRTVKITATRPIRKGEELFVSYGEKYWNTRNITKDEGSSQAS